MNVQKNRRSSIPKSVTPDAERRLRQASRLSRILRVLQLIQGRGKWDAKAVADELECSERTVYRDLGVLELAGIPWSYEKENQCYRVRSDFRFPTLNLTEDELLGQGTAVSITQAAGLDVTLGAKPTAEKLAIASDRAEKLLAEAQKLIEVLDLKLADHSQHREMIRTVQWALLQRKQLRGRYDSPFEPLPVWLTLHPYRLCLVKQAWYLIGRPLDVNSPKTFRVARFKSLQMTDVNAQVPENFDLKAHFGNAWAVYRGNQSYDVEIRFTKEAVVTVTETVWHKTQRVRKNKDGSVTMTFQVDGLNEILRWILGWGCRAKVIQPSELHEMVRAQLNKSLEAYQT